jgi:hypothetical protein
MATGAAIAAGVGAAGSAAMGYKASKDAEDAYDRSVSYMERAYAEAMGLNENVIEYWQQSINEWEEMFGPIEQNIADYYTNLDPEKYATEYKTNLQEYTQKYIKQFDETLAQSGVATSGMQLQAQKEAAFKQAQAGAGIDMAAPEIVAQQQQQYLNPYLRQKFSYEQNLGQSLTNQANLAIGQGQALGGLAGQQADMYGQSSQGWYQTAGNLFGMAGNLVGNEKLFGNTVPKTTSGIKPIPVNSGLPTA